MIPFSKPCLVGDEDIYIRQALQNDILRGNGPFTNKCETWLSDNLGCVKALLVHSCTAALEMAALLIDAKQGDEIIMPSYTFVSTANAFLLRGSLPVFIDVDPTTLNLDVNKIEAAITTNTKAIVPVHYAGVGCDMERVMAIAEQYRLYVIEDAAQSIMARYQNNPLGSIGHIGCFSFHDTKNIISGEGGAIAINDVDLLEQAEIIREKGTNRSKFFRGEVDKYTWIDRGSSYLPSELIAAFLYAQLQKADWITKKRLDIWDQYHKAFEDLELRGKIKRPVIPENCQANAHLYYLVLENESVQNEFIRKMAEQKIQCTFHYVPLHSSPMGKKYCRSSGNLVHTENIWKRLVRLPLYHDLQQDQIEKIVRSVYCILN